MIHTDSQPCISGVSGLKSLVRAVEVWETSPAGDSLQWSSGAYGSLTQFAEESRSTTFELGEGLPGMVWQTRSPHIMHSLFSGQFKRAEAARAAGLSCGIAIPFYNDREFRGVLVFLCDDGQDVQGAFEIWVQNERRELGLSSSYYANLSHFSRLSHFVKFPRGAGLPGQTWQMRFPRLVTSLSDSPAFMRGAGARACGLNLGLGLPCMRSAWELDSVVVMLSSSRTPLARAIEIWMRNGDDGFHFHSGHFGECSAIAPADSDLPKDAPSLARQVACAGKPIVFPNCQTVEPHRAAAFALHDVTIAVGMPIFVGSVLVASVILYL